MKKTLRSFLFVFPVFFVIIYIVTRGLLNGYFQQDEWLGIASVMNSYSTSWWQIYLPWVHFSPLGTFFWSTLYYVFELQAQYYFLIELMVHAAVATLVFILTARLTKNKAIAVIAAVLFLLNGRAHQAFTHLAIFHSTDSAMFFILLFFIYLTGVKEKVFKLKNIIILFLIFLAAVSIREEGFILIPTFGTYLFCFDRNKINRKNIVYFCFLALGVVGFLTVRFFAQTLNPAPIPSQYQIGTGRVVYNLATIPIKLVIQNLINYHSIAVFFLNHHEQIYPGMVKNIYNDAAPLMDAAFFYIFAIITAVAGIWMWLLRPKSIGLMLIFFSVWIFSHAFMLSFVGFPIFVLEPRYLYFSAFPVFCLVAVFMYTFYTSKSKFKIIDLGKRIVVVSLFVMLLTVSYNEIRAAVDLQIKHGLAKKEIFNNLLKIHPTLSQNTIFYIKCKTQCYRNGEFGIPNENVLPFSSGPGMNILVVYASRQNQEKEWGHFFTKEWLFHTFSEGYKKIGDRSFGYFTNKSKLEEVLSKNKISKDVVVALEVNESEYTFKDISTNFRKTLTVR